MVLRYRPGESDSRYANLIQVINREIRRTYHTDSLFSCLDIQPRELCSLQARGNTHDIVMHYNLNIAGSIDSCRYTQGNVG